MITIIVLWILLGLIAVIVILLHFSITAEIKGGTDTEFSIKLKYMCFNIYPRPPKKPKKQKHNKSAEKEDEFEDLEYFDDLDDSETSEEYCDLDKDKEQIFEQAVSEDTETTVTEPEKSQDEEIKNDSEKRSDKDVPKTERSTTKKKSKDKKQSKSEGKLDGLKKKFAMIKPYIPMGWKYFKKLLKTIRFTNTKIEIVTGKEDACESALFYGKLQGALFNLLALLSAVFTVKLKKADVQCVFNEKVFKANGETTVRVRPSAVIAIAFCIAVSFLKIFLPDFIRKRRAKKKKQKAADKSGELTNSGLTA